MISGEVYVFDTTALIDIYNHFPKQFRRLKRIVSSGAAKIPEGVFREIRRKTDKLRHYVERWEEEYGFVINIGRNPKLLSEHSRIELAYGERVKVGDKIYNGFWNSPAGRKAADGQLVAIGKVHNYTVVSDDTTIRYACFLENVQCIGWAEFARRLGSGTGTNQLEMDLPDS